MSVYWNRKILGWEARNYGVLSSLNPFSYALRRRQRIAHKIIKEVQFENCRIIEFASGSGLFPLRLVDGLGIKYCGLDISQSAIHKAQSRNYPSRVQTEFKNVDIVRGEETYRCDILIALGFSDWISTKDLEALLDRVVAQYLIISYTEISVSLASDVFVRFHRSRSKALSREGFPLRYTREDFANLLEKQGFSVTMIYGADDGLGIGRVVLAARKDNSSINLNSRTR